MDFVNKVYTVDNGDGSLLTNSLALDGAHFSDKVLKEDTQCKRLVFQSIDRLNKFYVKLMRIEQELRKLLAKQILYKERHEEELRKVLNKQRELEERLRVFEKTFEFKAKPI